MRPNDSLIDKLEFVFNNPGNRGFYAKCTMYIGFDELCRLVGYSLMYGRDPAKFFTVGANKIIKEKESANSTRIH